MRASRNWRPRTRAKSSGLMATAMLPPKTSVMINRICSARSPASAAQALSGYLKKTLMKCW